MEQLFKELEANNIICVTPENENILMPDQLQQIFGLLTSTALKYKDENFNMMPKLQNITLASGEVFEGVANANFKQGMVELLGIYIYDSTKIKYENVKGILQKHFIVSFYN